MRVLHVSARADSGGGPRVIATLIANSPPGFEHYVACPEELPYYERFRDLVGLGRMIAVPRRALRIGALIGLSSYIRDKHIAVVHSHGFGAGLYGRIAALAGGAASVHTFHGFFPTASSWPVRLLKIAVESILGLFTARLVAVSPSEARLIRRTLPHLRGRLEIVPNGLPAPPPAARRLKNRGSVNVLTVGRLVDQKNPLAILDIARLCRTFDSKREYVFRIVGDGPLRNALESGIRRHRLGNIVVLAGQLPDCASEYAEAGAYLSTARWEGLPLAVLEAMSAGLPVVATRVMGNSDAVEEGRTGYLFELGEPEVAARLITHLGANPDLRDALGRRARERVESEYNSAAMGRAYGALYRAAANRSSAVKTETREAGGAC